MPEHAFSEPASLSHGIGRDSRKRNAPSLFNVGLFPVLGWAGQFESLEAQVFHVLMKSGDFGIDTTEALSRIRGDKSYESQFVSSFGKPPDASSLASAIATFERTLLSGDSRVDRFLLNADTAALNPSERRGWALFTGKAGCTGCHSPLRRGVGPRGEAVIMFSDFRFHRLGVGIVGGAVADSGRLIDASIPQAVGAFRTPSLRNVALTAPYMHDGSLATLDDVVAFYDKGNPIRSAVRGLEPLNLSAVERRDLVAFLEALTSIDSRVGRPFSFRRDVSRTVMNDRLRSQ